MEQIVDVRCPTCGEPTAIWLDTGDQGSLEVESDCQVCCRPLHVIAVVRAGEASVVDVRPGW